MSCLEKRFNFEQIDEPIASQSSTKVDCCCLQMLSRVFSLNISFYKASVLL